MATEELVTRPAQQLTPAQQYGRSVEALAMRELEKVLGSEEGKKAAARTAPPRSPTQPSTSATPAAWPRASRSRRSPTSCPAGRTRIATSCRGA
jgi:hypothetical protein